MISFFNDSATTEFYTLSLHYALPIWFTKSAAMIVFRVLQEPSFLLLHFAAVGFVETLSKRFVAVLRGHLLEVGMQFDYGLWTTSNHRWILYRNLFGPFHLDRTHVCSLFSH